MAAVANSSNIADLIKDFEKFSEGQAVIVATVKTSINSIKAFSSIKIDEKVKDGLKNIKNIKKVFSTYTSEINEILESISFNGISEKTIKDSMALLSPDPKKTIVKFDTEGKKVSEESVEEGKGILDNIASIINLFKSITELPPVNKNKFMKTVVGYTDSFKYLADFVIGISKNKDIDYMKDASAISKTIFDSVYQLTTIIESVKEDIIPSAQEIVMCEKILKDGLTIIYNADDKKFSVVRNLISASLEMGKISRENVSLFTDTAEDLKDTTTSLLTGVGILGLPAVGKIMLNSSSNLKVIIDNIKECIKNLNIRGEELDPLKDLTVVLLQITENLLGIYTKAWAIIRINKGLEKICGKNPIEYLCELVSGIKIKKPGDELKENINIYKSSLENIIEVLEKVGNAELPFIKILIRLHIISKILSNKYFNEESLKSVNSLGEIFVSLSIAVNNIPQPKNIKRALESLLIIGETLGNSKNQDLILEALTTIELLTENRSKFSDLADIFESIKEVLIVSSIVSVIGIFAIPGLYILHFVSEILVKVLTGLKNIVETLSEDDLKKIKETFVSIREVVLTVALTMLISAIVGLLVLKCFVTIITGFTAIILVVLALASLMKLVDKIAGGKQFIDNAAALRNLGTLIIIAGMAIILSALIGILVMKYLKIILIGFAALMVVAIALAGLMALIGLITKIPGIKTGMLMFVLMLVSMLVAALIISIISKVGANIQWAAIFKFIGVIGLIVGTFAGIGLLMVAGGIILVAAAVGGIILIAVSLLLMTASIAAVNSALKETDPDTLKQNLTTMLDSMKFVIDYLNKNFSIKDTLKADAKIVMLADMSKRLMRMSKRMQKIASLTMEEFDENGHPTGKEIKMKPEDFVNAALNGVAVAQTIAAMFNDGTTEIKTANGKFKVIGISEAQLNTINNKTKRKFRQLNKITKSIANMTDTVCKIASMKIATEWNTNGQPIKFRSITPQDMKGAAFNGAALAELFAAIISDTDTSIIMFDGSKYIKTKISGIKTSAIEKIDRQMKKKMKMLSKCVDPIADMTETIIELAGGTVKKFDDTGKEIGTISLIKALESKDKIISSVKSIYSIFAEAMSCIVGKSESTEGKSFFGKVGTKIANGAKSVVNSISASFDADLVQKRVGAVIEPLKGMIECVQKISEISKNADQYAADNFKLLLTSAVAAVTNITAQDFGTLTARQGVLMEYAETIRKFMDANSNNAAPDNAAKTFDAAGKFVVKLNSVSDSKLDKMASIAKNMAAFAQKINGNFDKLADAMNDKLVKALEKVDETLKDVNKTFTEVPDKLPKPTGNAGVQVIQEQKPSTVKVTPKQEEKKKEIATAASKSLNNCIVQTEDGTFALAVVQKSE